MDPVSTMAMIEQAIHETDLVTARAHLEDLTRWINIGGFVPDGFYTVLDKYTELAEEMEAFI